MEVTKEYVKTLSEVEKLDLFDLLIAEGVDPVFVGYLIYDRDYRDVIEDTKKKDIEQNDT